MKNQKNHKMVKQPSVNLSHPKQLSMIFTGSKTLRFLQSVGTSSTTFTAKNVLDTLLMASTAILGFDIIQSYRVRHVEVWAANATSNIPVSVSVQFVATGTSGEAPTKVFTDTSIGASEPAHVKAIPPKDSASGFWQGQNSATNLFVINSPQGAIIDVCFEYCLLSEGASQAATNALVGATPGVLYGRGLDGVAIGATGYAMIPGSYPGI